MPLLWLIVIDNVLFKNLGSCEGNTSRAIKGNQPKPKFCCFTISNSPKTMNAPLFLWPVNYWTWPTPQKGTNCMSTGFILLHVHLCLRVSSVFKGVPCPRWQEVNWDCNANWKQSRYIQQNERQPRRVNQPVSALREALQTDISEFGMRINTENYFPFSMFSQKQVSLVSNHLTMLT